MLKLAGQCGLAGQKPATNLYMFVKELL
jgi:hypothetical protein